MHIVNNCPNPVFIPYAGRKKRGVQLNPGEYGPGIDISRVTDVKRLKADLEQSRILLAVSDDERALLKGRVNVKYLIDSSTATPADATPAPAEAPAAEEPESDVIATAVPAAVTDAADDAAAAEEAAPPAPTAETEESTDDTIAAETVTPPAETTEEPAAETAKVDPVLDELIANLDSLTPRGRATKLRHLRKSTDKAVIAALPAVEAHIESLKAAAKKPKIEVEVEADAKPKSAYADKNRAELMSAIVKRGIDVDPAAKDAELMAALEAADAAK